MSSREMRLIARGSPFELVERRVNGVSSRHYRHGPKTLVELYKRAEACGERPFVITADRGLSFSQLFTRARRVAQNLRSRFGVGPGSGVALLMGNGPEWLIAYIAITSIGGIALVIPGELPPAEMVGALADAKCSLIIIDEEGRTKFAFLSTGCPIIELPEASSGEPAELSCEIDPQQPAMIVFTSGTTGRPKGVVLSHYGILNGLMNMLLGGALAAARGAAARPLARESVPVSFTLAPFSHIAGYSSLLLACFRGGKIVTLPGWDAEAAGGLIERESVTSLVGVTPSMMNSIVNLPAHRAPLDSLRHVSFHGAAVSTQLVDAVRRRLPNVSVGAGYGMTETNGSICVAAECELIERPTTCGKPLPTVDLEIRPIEDFHAQDGADGEIWVRGPMLMLEYCTGTQSAAEGFRDGWFRTGDLGHLDADGYLHVADRGGNTVQCGDVRISCGAVERAVVEQRLAGEAVVFGVPDESDGEKLILAVRPIPGNRCRIGDILECLKLAGIPGTALARVVELAELPLTPSGKVDRRRVRLSLLSTV